MKLKLTSRLCNKVGDDYADFVCSNIDEVSSVLKYYGFTSVEGFYFILKETVSGTVSTFEFYRMPNANTIANYATDWTNRGSNSYQRYDLEFI